MFGGEKFSSEPGAPRNFKGQQQHGEWVIGRQLAVKRGPATLNSTKTLSPRDAYRTKGTGSRQFHCRVFPPHTKFYAAHPVSGFETTFISPTLPNDTPRQHPTRPEFLFPLRVDRTVNYSQNGQERVSFYSLSLVSLLRASGGKMVMVGKGAGRCERDWP